MIKVIRKIKKIIDPAAGESVDWATALKKPVRKVLLIWVMLEMTGYLSIAQAQEGVVLLHGLCRTKSSMKKIEEALVKSGFHVENIDYLSRTSTIDRLSETAIGKALENPVLRECSKIHFVTHSLGGLLVRSYFKRHSFDRLGRVVMIGPPNQGSEVVDHVQSWWVYKMLSGPVGEELTTAKDSTPNQLGPVNFELGVVAGDRSINWINSIMIHGRDDGKVSIEHTKIAGMKEHIVVHTAHPFMVKNRVVIQNTVRFLITGSFKKEEE